MPEDDPEQQSQQTDAEPPFEEAFALVGHKIRVEIIWALTENFELPFGELRSEIASDVEPSRLHYHLKQLVGHFVRRTDTGYQIRSEGIRLYHTLRAGSLDRQQEHLSLDPEFDCHSCGEPVEAGFKGGVIRIWCPECGNKYGHDFLDIPLTTFANDESSFSFAHFRKYAILKTFSLAHVVCPSCGNTLDRQVRGGGNLTSYRQVEITQTCDLCGAVWHDPIGRALLLDPDLVAFYYEHDIDVLSTPYWELEFAATDEHVTVRSTDPWEVALEVTVDGDTLELVVDGDLSVLERNRSTSPDPGSMSPQNGERSADGTPGNRQQGAGIVLPDEATCLQSLRRHRWPDGVTCPHCGSKDTIKQGTSKKNAQRYRCQTCESSFNDLTGTIFAKRGLSVPEMCYIIGEMDGTDTAQIARELDRSYNSVLQFVHQVKDARTGEHGFDPSEVFGDNGVG